jgi:hypothetical protein
VLRPAAPSFHDRQIPAAAPTGSARLAFLISASNLALYRVGGGVSLRQPAITCWRRPRPGSLWPWRCRTAGQELGRSAMRRAYETDEAGNMKVAQMGLW